VPKPTVIHGSADYSLASGLPSSASSCDTQSELRLDDTNNVVGYLKLGVPTIND
jgi:hypothetical protein